MSSRPSQVNSTDSTSSTARDFFHESVRSGDVESLVQMLMQEPLLSQAPSREREMVLLFVLVRSDADKAVEAIDLLMKNGVVLQWNVLLYACHYGVEWKVMECLMKWNALNGENALDWSQCEDYGDSPLLLACLRGQTQLALGFLDEIDVGGYSTVNHPFGVLDHVIEFGSEPHALAIAEHPKIQAAVQADYKDIKNKYYSLHSCVAHAVKWKMVNVLRLLDNLNHPKVSKATWMTVKYSEEQEKVQKTTNAEILGIANQFANDRRWEKVRGLLFLRHRGLDAEMVDGQLRADLLVGLPDPLFRLVVEFIKPSLTRRIDVDRVAFEFILETLD